MSVPLKLKLEKIPYRVKGSVLTANVILLFFCVFTLTGWCQTVTLTYESPTSGSCGNSGSSSGSSVDVNKSATISVPACATNVTARAWGGGGGGGGCSFLGNGRGGGSGAYVIKNFGNGGFTANIVVGRGGPRGEAGANNGASGNLSSVTYNGVSVTAGPGTGGNSGSGSNPGSGGTATGGDSGSSSGNSGSGGNGGNAPSGGNGGQLPSSSSPGRNGCNPGGGGSGGQCGSSEPGGHGGGGRVIVSFDVTLPVIAGTNTCYFGDTLKLTVTNPCSGFTYTWKKGGSVVGTGTGLTINDLTFIHAGTYTVEASMVCNYTEQPSNVSVTPVLSGSGITYSSGVLTLTSQGVAVTVNRLGACLNLYASNTATSEGCILLNWSWLVPHPDEYGYTLFQWDSDLGSWQTVSTNYDKTIQVLNVYPDVAGSDALQAWMHDPAVGLGKIIVTLVSITNFNANPTNYLMDGSGKYLYDAIMFGSWDANNSKDLSPASATAVRNFLSSGRGVLFGHDTQYTPYTNFVSLKDKTNLDIDPIDSRSTIWRGSTDIKVVNDGFLLKYPHLIPYESILTIPLTHTTGQLAKGIVWMNFPNTIGGSTWLAPSQIINGGTNDFYLTTWNNAAMIQTGHSGGTSTLDERKVIANTLWYLAQFTTDTTAKVCSARDIDAPEEPMAKRDTADCNKISMFSFDYGSVYSFYVKATNTTDYSDTCSSNVLTVENKSGLKGFLVLENNKPSSIPDTSSASIFVAAADSVTVIYNVQDLTRYVHIQAVDSAGNLGTVVTISPIPLTAITTHFSTDTVLMCENTGNFPSLSVVAAGTNLSYQWYRNTMASNSGGALISGATSASYSPTSALSPGNYYYYCIVSGCGSDTSNVSGKHIVSIIPHSATISAFGNNVCAGTSITFTASVTNGGSSPTYQWKKNGSDIVGKTDVTYTTTTLANGDVITCEVTSSELCAVPPSVLTNGITMIIIPKVMPAITITATPK